MIKLPIFGRAFFLCTIMLSFLHTRPAGASEFPLEPITGTFGLYSIPCDHRDVYPNQLIQEAWIPCVGLNVKASSHNFSVIRSYLQNADNKTVALQAEVTKLTETVEQNRLDLIMHVNAATVEKIRDQVRKELQSEMDAKIKEAVEKALKSR